MYYFPAYGKGRKIFRIISTSAKIGTWTLWRRSHTKIKKKSYLNTCYVYPQVRIFIQRNKPHWKRNTQIIHDANVHPTRRNYLTWRKFLRISTYSWNIHKRSDRTNFSDLVSAKPCLHSQINGCVSEQIARRISEPTTKGTEGRRKSHGETLHNQYVSRNIAITM
jgi:hypothetical protein